MLSALLSLSIIMAGQQAAPDEHQPFPPAHLKWTIKPLSSTIVTEWICAEGAKATTAKVRVADIGDGTRNARFRATLVELRVSGSQASRESVQRVRNALGQINNLHDFEGVCRDRTPVLEIRGSFYDGKQDQRKSFVIDLQPSP